MSARTLSTRRKLIYAALVTAMVLGLANLLISLAERAELLDTRRPDDMVHHLDDALFHREGRRWVTTSYAHRTLVPSQLPAEKRAGDYRLFLVGGSFAMGTPYSHQRHGEERPGGIASWLRAELEARFPRTRTQVLNLAAGGQSSTRASSIVRQTLSLQPDVVVVAACNNEGSLTPNAVEEGLRQLAGLRFLSKLIRPAPSSEARPLYTSQDEDAAFLATRFRENLQRVIHKARDTEVGVVLCTLPVNLLYEGGNPGILLSPRGEEQRLAAVSAECRAGDCPHDTVAGCALRASDLLGQGEIHQAEAALQGCDDLESLRLLGLIAHRRQEHQQARELLEQYTELVPRGRCRPSFNQTIRELAGSTERVHLADLQRTLAAIDPSGLADPDLFVDNCHLSWVGYSLAADTILDTLRAADELPSVAQEQPDLASPWERAQDLGLPPAGRMDLVGGPRLPSDEIPDGRDPWGDRPTPDKRAPRP